MHLFEEYNEFKEFINEAFKIKGYKDILTIIKEFNCLISEYTLTQDKNMIESKFYLENPVIVLDDYDDINMEDNRIDATFINQLCYYSKDKVKYIICGNGKFINKILYEYLIEGICDDEYEINYFNDFDFKINNKEVDNDSQKIHLDEFNYFGMNVLNKKRKGINIFEELLKDN
jgi:hypothetical protein